MKRILSVVVFGVLMVPGFSGVHAQSCAETPVCEIAAATIGSAVTEIKNAEDMSMTNSSLSVALINRIAIGCMPSRP